MRAAIDMQLTPDEATIEAAMRRLLATRAGRSICPSEVARMLVTDEDGWRALMPQVRDVARRLARDGVVQLLRNRIALDPDAPGPGPIRIATSTPGVTSV